MKRIWIIFCLSWLNVKRDRLALTLTFVLPLVFFSIFAAVFGGMDRETIEPVTVVLVLEDESELGNALAGALGADPRLSLERSVADRAAARARVQAGRVEAAVVVPDGLGRALRAGSDARIEILADTANPVATQLVSGAVRTALLEAGHLLARRVSAGVPAAGIPAPEPAALPVRVVVEDVLGGSGKRPSIAYFAAGIGVMFLLFAVSGRSAILIEEQESGVLERLLSSRLRMGELLIGRWLFLAVLGFAQVTVMFVWGALVFDLDLWTPRHLLGFTVLTAITAAAAAGFGLLLATTCRTRAQLNGVAVVVVLIMSTLGGSMFPRFLMPEGLARFGKLTFNAWALEGYQKIFWYELPLAALAPQLLVLAALATLFLLLARLLARRWERAWES